MCCIKRSVPSTTHWKSNDAEVDWVYRRGVGGGEKLELITFILSLKKCLARSQHTSCEIQVHRDARFPSNSCRCPSRLPHRTPSCEFSRAGCLAGSWIKTISDDNGPLSGTGVATFSSSHVYELCSCHSKAGFGSVQRSLSFCAFWVVSLASHTVKMGRCMHTGRRGRKWMTTTAFQNLRPASSNSHIRRSLYPSPTTYHLNILL